MPFFEGVNLTIDPSVPVIYNKHQGGDISYSESHPSNQSTTFNYNSFNVQGNTWSTRNTDGTGPDVATEARKRPNIPRPRKSGRDKRGYRADEPPNPSYRDPIPKSSPPSSPAMSTHDISQTIPPSYLPYGVRSRGHSLYPPLSRASPDFPAPPMGDYQRPRDSDPESSRGASVVRHGPKVKANDRSLVRPIRSSPREATKDSQKSNSKAKTSHKRDPVTPSDDDSDDYRPPERRPAKRQRKDFRGEWDLVTVDPDLGEGSDD